MPGLNLSHLKHHIVDPALEAIGLFSPAALNLVTGTALVESAATYLVQNGGPALGLWQMEPATERDCWDNFIKFDAALSAAVKSLLPPMAQGDARTQQLIGNLSYAAAMCRVKYRRSPQALPAADDAAGLCQYWKAVYNSSLGAGVTDAAHVSAFEQAIRA